MNGTNHDLKLPLKSILALVVSSALGPAATAQAPAGLVLRMYAGLTITGAVGTVYSIQYATDLAHTNSANAWRCLEFLQLPVNPNLWLDKSAPATGQRFYRAIEFPAPTNLVFIPPGTFRMGSATNEVDRGADEGPQTAVTISRGFWMGRYEVTQGEYQAVTGSNPSWFNGDRTSAGYGDYGVDLNRPVEWVSWEDATNYCGQLTERERTAGRIPTNCVYRLPTETEWEYACRAWTSSRFSYEDDPGHTTETAETVGYTNLTNYAWYLENCGWGTHPVGQKLPNPWGLYDMHGNVWEWCQDWLGPYPGGSVSDPKGPAWGGDRVLRGGSWSSLARCCRSADRCDYRPDFGESFGFRVVLAPGQP